MESTGRLEPHSAAMPEGPEIRRQADRLHRILAGKPAVHVFFGVARLAPLADGLRGRTVERVWARGKALLTGFDDARVVYSHNQLYGRWRICRADRPPPPTRRQLRFEVRTDTHRALLYSASTLEVMSEGELDHHPFLSRLGPDPLDRETTEHQLRRWIRESRFARRRLGGLLLEQGFVAGIGNYLRSEILFGARLHPDWSPGDLSAAESRRLARVVLEVTRRSYETGGITRPAREAARLKAQGLPRRRYRHQVFGLAGHPCPRCATPIQKAEVAGRRAYLCLACQPPP